MGGGFICFDIIRLVTSEKIEYSGLHRCVHQLNIISCTNWSIYRVIGDSHAMHYKVVYSDALILFITVSVSGKFKENIIPLIVIDNGMGFSQASRI